MAVSGAKVKDERFLPARSDIPPIDFAKHFARLPDLITHAGEGETRSSLLRPRGAAQAAVHAAASTGAGAHAITGAGAGTQAPTNVTEIVRFAGTLLSLDILPAIVHHSGGWQAIQAATY